MACGTRLAACLTILLSVISTAEEAPTSLRDDLHQLRGWDSLGREKLTPLQWKKYFEWANRFQRLDHVQRKTLITNLVGTSPDYKARFATKTKLYVLLRITYHVSDNTTLKVPTRWIGNDRGSLLWPLGYDENGELKLLYPFLGFEGPEYNPLFDYTQLRNTFKLRLLGNRVEPNPPVEDLDN